MKSFRLDEGLLADDTGTIDYFLFSVPFSDIPVTGDELDRIFVIVFDMDRVDVEVL